MNILRSTDTLPYTGPKELRLEILFEFLAAGGVQWSASEPERVWTVPEFWRLLGYALPLDTCPLALVGQLVAQPDIERVRTALAQLALDQRSTVDLSFAVTHRDESQRWIRLQSIKLQTSDAQEPKLTGLFTDVTVLEDFEGLLHDSLRLARVGGWTLNVKTKKITWTPVTREIHQVPDDFEPDLDNGIQFYQSGYSRDRITQVVTEACRNGTPYDEELQLVTFTGKVIWVRAIGRAEFRDGQCVRLYGIFQDVHAKKSRERQQARISVMKARNRELEKFAYITSHDLRQPVRTVLSYCELLQEDFGAQLAPEALRYINVIGTAAEHMDALILGILEHSRLGRPKEMEHIDVNRILTNVLSSLDSLVRKNGAQIDLASPLPKLWGYPVEMAMLWQNLLENAIKFSRSDVPPRIAIDVEQIEGGWHFTVSDNGIGISARDHQEIFGFFRRLHSQDRYEGYGVGLAHCKKIVELHYGRIWVTSQPGQGSQFHFTILTDEPAVPQLQDNTSSMNP